ncbi:MAG: type IX secretion system membrane protein PorP/SprF [Flavobacteriaceae bacterium]|jgi:type IX secretion system PorP/SprF family membrane protein|nr:type IX secretion system membrane protein PorP/SprF [Flavobacteriaceae bacterium]MDG1028299.1 type IX secretion system membrane protein PorP/SprF [Flavobacteriaceae bacterium]MDG1941022.1 type IX secretion system membrane protein PorP/SprF [Flavobacteriaceae bacterium]
MLFKKRLTLMMISTIFFGRVVSAQQDTHFTMYRNHMSIFNPAVTGTEERGFINLSYKNQWQGVDQAPQTQAISFGTPLGGERAGLGFNVINDATFIEDQTSFFITFSYRLSLSENTQLYLGIQGGGNAFRVNGTALRTMSDQGLVSDPILIDHSQFNPNVGVGLYLKTQKAFISLSAPKILNTERFVEQEGFFTAASDRVHTYFSAGNAPPRQRSRGFGGPRCRTFIWCENQADQ